MSRMTFRSDDTHFEPKSEKHVEIKGQDEGSCYRTVREDPDLRKNKYKGVCSSMT